MRCQPAIDGLSAVSLPLSGFRAPKADAAVVDGVIGLFLGLAWIFFCMRMYVRAVLTKAWAKDDLLLVIAIVSARSPGF